MQSQLLVPSQNSLGPARYPGSLFCLNSLSCSHSLRTLSFSLSCFQFYNQRAFPLLEAGFRETGGGGQQRSWWRPEVKAGHLDIKTAGHSGLQGGSQLAEKESRVIVGWWVQRALE